MQQSALRLPAWMVVAVVGLCLLPILLTSIGVTFDLRIDPAAISSSGNLDATIRSLSGTYIHTLLEWTATVLAVVTAVLAFSNFLVTRDIVTPIIGFALLTAGLVDAFHVLAADRLIYATADNRNFIPFTWAISRTFNAVIPVVALGLIFLTRHFEIGTKPRHSFLVIAAISTIIAGLAYALIQYCATSSNLPQTMFPDALITRPWDVLPLLIYALSGLVLYPLFGRRIHSYFAVALWLSVLPDIATQLHMAFGSAELFDTHFNIAHFLKIVAYLVPCIGLLLDYVATHERADQLQAAVTERAEELARSNSELEKFAYVASHDLKAPLRAIDNLSGFIEEDLGEIMDEGSRKNMTMLRRRVRRLSTLLDDLLKYSRVGRFQDGPETVSTLALAEDIVQLFEVPQGITVRIDDNLPTLYTEKAPLEMVLRNLVGNAIKHRDADTSEIGIAARQTEDGYEFSVTDDGPGIPAQYHEKIFGMFQTLQSRDSREGSGMGLAIIRKQVEIRGGSIRVISEDGQRGTRFEFDWPAAKPE